MDKVHNPSDSEFYTPSSEPFRLYLNVCVLTSKIISYLWQLCSLINSRNNNLEKYINTNQFSVTCWHFPVVSAMKVLHYYLNSSMDLREIISILNASLHISIWKEYSSARETTNRPYNQATSTLNILWNPTSPCAVPKSPLLISIPSQVNPGQTLPPCETVHSFLL
jgi:hypothetical protein